MTREIKFRGKRLDNGKWEIGNLLVAENRTPYILPPEICEVDGHHIRQGDDVPRRVDPATVGQFSGLKDQNGVEIYDGDILTDKFGSFGVVEWRNGGFFVNFQDVDMFSISDCFDDSYQMWQIGNIHDNPELIKNK